jgi:hypothetical protein
MMNRTSIIFEKQVLMEVIIFPSSIVTTCQQFLGYQLKN